MSGKVAERLIRLNGIATVVPIGIFLAATAVDVFDAFDLANVVDVFFALLVNSILVFIVLSFIALEYLIVTKKSLIASWIATLGFGVVFLIFSAMLVVDMVKPILAGSSPNWDAITIGLGLVAYTFVLGLGHWLGVIRNRAWKARRGFEITASGCNAEAGVGPPDLTV